MVVWEADIAGLVFRVPGMVAGITCYAEQRKRQPIKRHARAVSAWGRSGNLNEYPCARAAAGLTRALSSTRAPSSPSTIFRAKAGTGTKVVFFRAFAISL